jgi:uncharacterized membrane protein
MSEDARVPGKGWYVLAGVIAFATVVGIGGIAAWLYLEYDAGKQFLAPGRHAIELKKSGGYLVWNDYRTVYQGRSYDESEHLPKGAQISVIERSSGRALAVDSSRGGTNESGSNKSVAVAQFYITQPGAYEIVVEGDFPPRVFSVGRNLLFQIAGGFFGAFALVFIGFSAALAIAGWAFLKREEAGRTAAHAQAPATGQLPAGQAAPSEDRSLRNITAIVYGLQIAGFFVGITFIAAVIINYLKRKEVEGTWLESHFRWQIRTFWFGLLWSTIGVVLLFVLVGIVVLMGVGAWVLYRAIKGWVALEDGKPLPV